jgi:hypothetical protein
MRGPVLLLKPRKNNRGQQTQTETEQTVQPDPEIVARAFPQSRNLTEQNANGLSDLYEETAHGKIDGFPAE